MSTLLIDSTGVRIIPQSPPGTHPSSDPRHALYLAVNATLGQESRVRQTQFIGNRTPAWTRTSSYRGLVESRDWDFSQYQLWRLHDAFYDITCYVGGVWPYFLHVENTRSDYPSVYLFESAEGVSTAFQSLCGETTEPIRGRSLTHAQTVYRERLQTPPEGLVSHLRHYEYEDPKPPSRFDRGLLGK